MAEAAIRAPRSLNEAQRLCERFVALDEQIVAIEAARDAAIAKANAEVDAALAPLLVHRGAIRDKLEPWWAENAQLLTQGKRKSAELGGVVLGSRTGKAKLALAGAVDEIVAQLRKIRGGMGLVRVKHELDRTAAMAALAGKNAERLKSLGISREDGAETFYIERTSQAGTQPKLAR